MTSPADPPAVDLGNALLAKTPSQLTGSVLDTPVGQCFGLTIRTPSTTLTVLLTATEAKAWAKQLSETTAMMSETGLTIASSGHVKPASPSSG